MCHGTHVLRTPVHDSRKWPGGGAGSALAAGWYIYFTPVSRCPGEDNSSGRLSLLAFFIHELTTENMNGLNTHVDTPTGGLGTGRVFPDAKKLDSRDCILMYLKYWNVRVLILRVE